MYRAQKKRELEKRKEKRRRKREDAEEATRQDTGKLLNELVQGGEGPIKKKKEGRNREEIDGKAKDRKRRE